jgi:hypothetical protein
VNRRVPGSREAGYNVAFAWFPPDQWPKATERWPDLLDERPADPLEYSHVLESVIKQYQEFVRGNTFHVAPMTVEGLVAFCAERDTDPATGDGRAQYAATLLQFGEAVAWPPGRNEPCWCRSGRKYKQCCGPVPPKPFPTDLEAEADPEAGSGTGVGSGVLPEADPEGGSDEGRSDDDANPVTGS